MNDIGVTHFYSWQGVPDNLAQLFLREFADNGARNIVLTPAWALRLIQGPPFCSTLKNWLRKFGLSIFEFHGLWGPGYDLNTPDRPRCKAMIEEHKLCMEYAAEFGCKTCTIHVGQYYRGMESSVEEALERLIPAAEKAGIVLAIENGMDPGCAPDALLRYLTKFTSPNFGCCFDTGHANVMYPATGKKTELYAPYVHKFWEGNIILEGDPIGKLAPHLVTAHLHDNDGYSDAHMLPGTGTIEWDKWLPALKRCPRLVSLQNETNAAGHQVSIRKLCETIDALVKRV